MHKFVVHSISYRIGFTSRLEPDHVISHIYLTNVPYLLYLQELEEILCEEGSGSIEVACEGVFSIKLLLALESKYEAYANR